MNEMCYKILIADDEYWIRENLRNLLDWSEYSFEFMEPAVDGQDALLKMESCCPDILITDINMPFLSGTELLQVIKERFPHVVTIVLSGYNDFTYVREALLSRAIDYLLKPITKIDLINVLTNALNIISTNKAQELEKESIKSELLMAASLIRDREFSMLIASDELSVAEGTHSQYLPHIEFGFINFFVAVVKIYDLYHLPMSNNMPKQLPYQIKEKLHEIIQDDKAVTFNNIFSPTEFIVVIDKPSYEMNRLCTKILEGLKKITSSFIHIGLSHRSLNFDIRNAYLEAISALMFIKYDRKNVIINTEEVADFPISQRVSPEHEKQLLLAIKNKNKKHIRQLIFSEIGLKSDCQDWLFLEVKHTVERLTWLLSSNTPKCNSAFEVLAMENLIELLSLAVNSFNISEICSIIEEVIEEAFSINDLPGQNDTMQKTIQIITSYIDEKYFEELSLTSLSKMFLVERSYLSKLFKQEVGENLMLYIAKKRVEKAIELIKKSNVTLTEISFLVGYDDYAYFNRVFRKVTGKSPREYKTTFEGEAK
ncbi:MAG: DNA-binding response regulator [Clostridia bacterium]|jgi:YesN/AraC family two-component response regulator|nr:DNA-binding response regulator [Clostridia bacterium]